VSTLFRPADGVDSCKLFPGTNADQRFGAWLQGILNNMPAEDQVENNLSIGRHGTNSVRKGIYTYLMGLSAGAPPANINIRGGHSVGCVGGKYIFHSEGADQYIGRLCSGLDNFTKDIAVLPPHFHNFAELLPDRVLTEVVAGYASFPQCFQACVPFLLASLAYNKDALPTLLRSQPGKPMHDFWNSRYLYYY
jgi:hypothetical protein